MFRIIGDVHGYYQEYLNLIADVEFSLQLGDLDFDYSFLDGVDSTKHKIILGNHDNYDLADKYPHFLGDYGYWLSPIGESFFVRGERSIDYKYRTVGKDFWNNEELNYREMNECLETWTSQPTDIVFSHGCPGSLIDVLFGQKTWDGELLKPSNTALLLNEMLKVHRPKLWMFGHHHRNVEVNIDGTTFICLAELAYRDFV